MALSINLGKGKNKMCIINTSSVDTLYDSLDNAFGVNSGSVKAFLLCNLQKFINLGYWEIDLKQLYEEFSLSEEFSLESITIHHVTTRLGEVKQDSFTIDNLETVLLSENTLTQFLKKYKIEFKHEDGISVYYRGTLHKFKGYAEARLRNRLSNLRDSCVNGFLFAENMDNSYVGLTGMPEIYSDLMTSLNREDLQYKFFDEMKCYMATVKVSLSDFIFDDFSKIKDSSEKTKLILQYIFNYLCYKLSRNQYYYFENPIVRLPDNANVGNSDILALRQITDYTEIFKK